MGGQNVDYPVKVFQSFTKRCEMKKLVTLILAAGMAFSAASGASAVDIKVSGEWLFGGNFTDNILGGGNGMEPLQEGAPSGNFTARQRIRLTLDMSVNEALSGVMQLQVGNGETMPHALTLGSIDTGGPGKAVTARWAYLDWRVPGTEARVRMGRQPFATPVMCSALRFWIQPRTAWRSMFR